MQMGSYGTNCMADKTDELGRCKLQPHTSSSEDHRNQAGQAEGLFDDTITDSPDVYFSLSAL